jgi:hypothetical protein
MGKPLPKTERSCLRCGRRFLAVRACYCSPACTRFGQRAGCPRLRTSPKDMPPVREKACAFCGRLFVPPSRWHSRYCSRSDGFRCRDLARMRPLEVRLCGFCGQPFVVGSNAHQACCSTACSNRVHGAKRRGKNHRCWKGGVSTGKPRQEYMARFKQARREAGLCPDCGRAVVPGLTHCQSCRDRERERRATGGEAMRERERLRERERERTKNQAKLVAELAAVQKFIQENQA